MPGTALRRVFLFLIIFTWTSQAQIPDKAQGSEKSRERYTLPEILAGKSLETRVSSMPMEGPIDPASYIVGPSDIITIAVWGPVSFATPLIVSPEGSLIIPSVGEAYVAGKSLKDIKQEISKLIRKRYPMGDISVTLTTPRTFTVVLRGAVLNPGQYISSSVDRVEKIIRAGTTQLLPTASMSFPPSVLQESADDEGFKIPKIDQTMELYEKASQRNIKLIRRNRDTVNIDILKYYATGEEKHNPFLKDGDIIFVPKRNIEQNFVSIRGAVNAPGKYEFVQGDRLSDLIQIAQGIVHGPEVQHVIISRLDREGKVQEELKLDLKEIINNRSFDPFLQRGDRILVQLSDDRRDDYFVTIQGEIHSPGQYPVSRDNTRLSEIFKTAGGVTEYALLPASMLFRKIEKIGNPVSRQYEILLNWRSSQLNFVDSTYYLHMLREGLAPVSVDFQKALNGDKNHDVILQSDDLIIIPVDRRTVLVDGQVAKPGYQPYIPGASLEDYIRNAGGYSEFADISEICIIKRGTLEWTDPDETEIESGDRIWIPRKIRKDFTFYLSLFRDVAAFTAGLATTGLLIYQISKNK